MNQLWDEQAGERRGTVRVKGVVEVPKETTPLPVRLSLAVS